ncbi:MAG: hypothetical protein OXE94_01840 [Aestuariivita sp.]|nr:hypothetical protein [Aestuariivita sp.]MCY4202801.1 hypothetical protein [Aestuariivita sp.]
MCKEVLGLANERNDKKSFLRNIISPLIKPGMRIYDELDKDIFGIGKS